MQVLLGIALVVLSLGYGLFAIWAGTKGISIAWGTGWAIAALVLALGFRFTLPMTIGMFYLLWKVWGWHWFFAGLAVCPGLLVMIPAVLGSIVEAVKGKWAA